jgi:hypothetical protein
VILGLVQVGTSLDGEHIDVSLELALERDPPRLVVKAAREEPVEADR